MNKRRTSGFQCKHPHVIMQQPSLMTRFLGYSHIPLIMVSVAAVAILSRLLATNAATSFTKAEDTKAVPSRTSPVPPTSAYGSAINPLLAMIQSNALLSPFEFTDQDGVALLLTTPSSSFSDQLQQDQDSQLPQFSSPPLSVSLPTRILTPSDQLARILIYPQSSANDRPSTDGGIQLGFGHEDYYQYKFARRQDDSGTNARVLSIPNADGETSPEGEGMVIQPIITAHPHVLESHLEPVPVPAPDDNPVGEEPGACPGIAPVPRSSFRENDDDSG